MADYKTNLSSNTDIVNELQESEEALQNLRFQKSMQQLEDLSQIKKTKKKIARLKTIIYRQKMLNESEK